MFGDNNILDNTPAFVTGNCKNGDGDVWQITKGTYDSTDYSKFK